MNDVVEKFAGYVSMKAAGHCSPWCTGVSVVSVGCVSGWYALDRD